MDSMRSLNTSLPRTSPPKQSVIEPSETLLAAFKSAALSVTQLYKTAAADQGSTRAEGYQDALDELLAFLDKEDIGLSDGEGWRIRRWATERLDGRESVPQNDSDDEIVEKADRASSPIQARSQSTSRAMPVQRTRKLSPSLHIEAPPPAPASTSTTEEPTIISTMVPQSSFSFQSSHSYPQDADIILSDLEARDQVRISSGDTTGSHISSGPTTTRSSASARANLRHNSHTRLNNRGTSGIGRGAGHKRKINIGDFFDIGNLGGKDGSGGGGKRGRFT